MRIDTLFGIELPLVQAPMAGVQDSDLTIAVCRAGGLGSLPCAMLTPEAVLSESEKIRAHTDRPFNLNFFCHNNLAASQQQLDAWKSRFGGYYAEWEIDPASVGPGAIRQPFNQAMADVVCAIAPAVVSFHFGLPPDALVQQVRKTGAKIMSSATTVEEARWLEQQGVDAIIAQGIEAGGHRGIFLTHDGHFDLSTQTGTFALLPQIVRAVTIPVIAAGGMADAACIKAAFTLGASGVQVGTSYLLCKEAKTSAVHRAALRSDAAKHTAVTNIFTGRPARGIVNRMMRDFGLMAADAPVFPNASAASGPIRSKAEAAGSGDFSPLWAGQNTSGCKAISAEELTRELMVGFSGTN